VRRLVGALVVLAVAAAGCGFWVLDRLDAPGPGDERRLLIARGQGPRDIGRQLEAAGVVADRRLFWLAVWLDRSRPLQAGEYLVPAGASPVAIAAQMRDGRTVVRRLTVPEGLTVAQVMALVAAAEGLVGEPPSPPPEGALLPETYHYRWGDGRADLVQRMRRAMDEALADAWNGRVSDLPLADPKALLTLAAIVEKETSVADERARVAGVFVNRLRRGMRLQSDPTVVYALTGGRGPLDRALTRADLDRPHPFNTYQIAALPPGPIANPGRSALRAAARPLDTDDLFFVADGTGGHAFARTLEEHNRNVARWRRLQRGERSP
jgi:UPF0755 protein